MIDRYHEVGLRRNPFVATPRTGIDHELFVPRGLPDPPAAGARALVQVIGDQGAGKTTHVQHWRRRRPGPYHYIPRLPYRDRWIDAPVEPLVYGDEIDRMPRPLRRRWFRDLGAIEATVVIGTHRDLTRLGRRFGLEVTTHHLPPLDRETLTRIIDRRLDAEMVEQCPVPFDHKDDHGDRPTFRFEPAEIDQIFERSGGSVREAEVLCHELLAERVR